MFCLQGEIVKTKRSTEDSCVPLYPHQDLEKEDNNIREICQEFSRVG